MQLRVLQSKPCLPQIPVKDGKMIKNGTAQQKAIIRRDLRRVKILWLASGKLNVIHLEITAQLFSEICSLLPVSLKKCQMHVNIS